MKYVEKTFPSGVGGSYTATHTDHSDEIAEMYRLAREMMETTDPAEATVEQALTIATLRCAAALLEVHDDTGISLDKWDGPDDLVNYGLWIAAGMKPEDRDLHFLPNHV